MKNNTTVAIFIIVIILLVAGIFTYFYTKPPLETIDLGPTPTVTPTPVTTQQSVSDGTVTLNYPSNEFGLAVNASQILVNSYIPPCDPTFSYCLYYTGDEYKGTNFESAGVRMQKRTDLATENVCLTTPPAGFASMKPAGSNSSTLYSSSVFSPVGDAAAGHYADGSLYRLFVKSNSTCYEFESRVAQSQFANYPSGTIKEFTASDKTSIQGRLLSLINAISLGGQSALFPKI
jgi:hypothetical protein